MTNSARIPDRPRFELVSLFAGAGGLDLGLERAGFVASTVTDIEPPACETLRRNKKLAGADTAQLLGLIEEASAQRCFNRLSAEEKDWFFHRLLERPSSAKYLATAKVIEGDIREIPSEELLSSPDANVFAVAGGPPCQPFSKAGKQKALDCTKNGDLFYEFVRVVGDLQPNWFIFENVKGITFTPTDVLYSVCGICCEEELADFKIRQNFAVQSATAPKCGSCGSGDTGWQVRNERGGSLRIIKREFERLGYKCEEKVLNAADFGAPQIRERLFIIGSREHLSFDWPIPTNQRPQSVSKQASLLDSADSDGKPWRTMYDALWAEGHQEYGSIDREKAVLWVKNVVRPHDEPVTWHLDRPSPTIGAHQSAKLALAPIGVPEAQLTRQQWHTRGRRQGDIPPVPVEHCYLSDEELLRLQTFPRWWYLHGTRMQRAFQIGNAVPPVLAEAVGRAVIEAQLAYEQSNEVVAASA